MHCAPPGVAQLGVLSMLDGGMRSFTLQQSVAFGMMLPSHRSFQSVFILCNHCGLMAKSYQVGDVCLLTSNLLCSTPGHDVPAERRGGARHAGRAAQRVDGSEGCQA